LQLNLLVIYGGQLDLHFTLTLLSQIFLDVVPVLWYTIFAREVVNDSGMDFYF
jgi:hypothetical protein